MLNNLNHNNNHHAVFTSIYEKYIDKIFRFIYLKVDAKETAQDICSDVFTRTWKRIQEGRTIDNPQAYLYKTAQNLIADFYREKDKVQSVPMEALDRVVDPNRNLDVERKAILCSEMDAVKKALNNIKPSYQDIVIWHYLDDLTIQEISEITGKSQAACRVMLSRGLKSLRKQLS